MAHKYENSADGNMKVCCKLRNLAYLQECYYCQVREHSMNNLIPEG
jgi:hypothetical protein